MAVTRSAIVLMVSASSTESAGIRGKCRRSILCWNSIPILRGIHTRSRAMRLHTTSVTTVELTAPPHSGSLEQRFALFGGMVLLFTLALLLPGLAQPEHYHAFA